MKRYLFFAYDQYYPCGGWTDFRSDHDTVEGAHEAASLSQCDYKEIIDLETGDDVYAAPLSPPSSDPLTTS
jgi:hypothetical protein